MAKHNLTPRGDALDSLRGSGPASDAPQADDAVPLLIDYRGRTGEDQRHAHEGPCVTILSGREPMCLQPGLNLIDDFEQWTAYGKHKAIAAKLGDGRLVQLRALPTGQALYELADRSRSPEALEHILRFERAKKATAGRAHRRSPELVALLERRIAKLAGRPPINVSGIEALAKQATAAVAG